MGLPCKLPPGTVIPLDFFRGRVEASGDDWVLIRQDDGTTQFRRIKDWNNIRRQLGNTKRPIEVGSIIWGYFRGGGVVKVEAVGHDWIVVRSELAEDPEYFEVEDWDQFKMAVYRGTPVPPPFPGLRMV